MMVQAIVTSAIAVALLFGGGPTPGRARAAQAASIPLNVIVTATPGELTAGATARIEVRLKNYLGNPVPAPENMVVTLHSDLSGDASIPIKAGQSSGQIDVRFLRAGVATLVASAPNLSSGSASVVVNGEAAPRPSPPPPAAATAAGAAPAPPGGAMLAAGPSAAHSIRLGIDVLPDHVHPLNAVWTAKVLVTAIDDSRQPVQVPADTFVQLSTDEGLITPNSVTIGAGHARANGTITLTTNKPGRGTLWAWTDSGDLFRASVEYHAPTLTQLAVKALPTRTLNDGRTAIHVTVFLQDESSGFVNAEGDVQVKLTSSVGTLTPSVLSVPKGQFVGEAILTSATSGTAEITASAAGVRSGLASVEFLFPVLLVTVAALGGVVGALLRSSGESFTGAWWWHLAGSLGIGAVLGLLFYGLAMFGVIASIPSVPMLLGVLPTSNEFVALLLGFFGGYWARSWIPNLDSVTSAGKPAAPKTESEPAGAPAGGHV